MSDLVVTRKIIELGKDRTRPAFDNSYIRVHAGEPLARVDRRPELDSKDSPRRPTRRVSRYDSYTPDSSKEQEIPPPSRAGV
jgi:hypothetical protein